MATGGRASAFREITRTPLRRVLWSALFSTTLFCCAAFAFALGVPGLVALALAAVGWVGLVVWVVLAPVRNPLHRLCWGAAALLAVASGIFVMLNLPPPP